MVSQSGCGWIAMWPTGHKCVRLGIFYMVLRNAGKAVLNMIIIPFIDFCINFLVKKLIKVFKNKNNQKIMLQMTSAKLQDTSSQHQCNSKIQEMCLTSLFLYQLRNQNRFVELCCDCRLCSADCCSLQQVIRLQHYSLLLSLLGCNHCFTLLRKLLHFHILFMVFWCIFHLE